MPLTYHRLASCLTAFLLTALPVYAQSLSHDPVNSREPNSARSNAEIREEWKEVLNANLVTIISGNPNGSYLRIAYDISAVTSQGNELRVIPMIGKGAVQNTRDIMFLRGVDMGLVNLVALKYFNENQELGTNLQSQLSYITPLFQDELHVLARKEIKKFKDLEGRRVNFSDKGSGAQLSSRTIFNALGMNVQEFNMGQAQAIEMMKRGELEATLCTCLKPLSAHSRVKPEDNLHLLPVSYDPVFQELYLPAEISHEDYPDLVPEGQVIETIAVQTLLASYNWPRNHPRYKRMEKFVAAFFENFGKLMKPPRHPRWNTVNLAAKIPGWQRFPAAQEWLDKYSAKLTAASSPASENNARRAAFEKFLNASGRGKFSSLEPRKRDALYAEFVEWVDKKIPD